MCVGWDLIFSENEKGRKEKERECYWVAKSKET